MTITRLDLAPILLLSTHDRPAAYGTLAYLPARLVDRDKAFSSLGLEPNRLLITAQLRSHVRVFAQIGLNAGLPEHLGFPARVSPAYSKGTRTENPSRSGLKEPGRWLRADHPRLARRRWPNRQVIHSMTFGCWSIVQ